MKGTESWQILDGGKSVSIRPQGRFKADNGRALVAAALAGLGIACLPDSLIGEHVSAGALVRIMTRYPTPPAGGYVLRPPTQHPPKKIKVLTDLLAQHFDIGPAQAGSCISHSGWGSHSACRKAN